MADDGLRASMEAVRDEASFLRFVERLAADRRAAAALEHQRDGHQGPWANQTIEDFLSAAHHWAQDSSFGLRPGPRPDNPWQLFALFLWCGRLYE